MGAIQAEGDPLSRLHPCSRRWFERAFSAPTLAQHQAWPALQQGHSVLLVAPTGSGKTLAAFFSALDRLLFGPDASVVSGQSGRSTWSESGGELVPGQGRQSSSVRVLYVSPLKALASDIQRNLQAPLDGLCELAEETGLNVRRPRVQMRSGDTPPGERQRMRKDPPDILITTPESLYLMLGSSAQEMFCHVETVIVDEIHAIATSKRGAHLFLSLERIERLRRPARDAGAPAALQRIGLSATQRPVAEIARLLGGYQVVGGHLTPRPITILDAAAPKPLELGVEVTTRDMKHLSDSAEWPVLAQNSPGPGAGMASDGTAHSIWPALVPRLVELIREHRSTIVFVNSRGSSERLAGAINEAAGTDLVKAHHGSLAQEARADVEQLLKNGSLPGIVATSSLELGIDMGHVDLVLQVGAPPSVASGLQRVGRAQHQVGGVPKGVFFPTHRGDLLACAAMIHAMHHGQIERSRYPRNPLDVLAGQICAIVAAQPIQVMDLFDLVRGSAPFASLELSLLHGVLDMLTGRYPSDDFAELRPRLTWNRSTDELSARRGTKMVALINGGTIPDRGLYGVFLVAGEGKRPTRVGELDEEMVFESRVGDVFLLGASSWRVEEITQDRVLVTPAPGLPGRMPFWHGDGPGRPLDFGYLIAELLRKLSSLPQEEALRELGETYHLNPNASSNLLAYLHEQGQCSALPTDQQLVIERFLDEVGDQRVCVLSPLGSRVHAPWAIATKAQIEKNFGLELDVIWSDDGIVFRLGHGDRPLELRHFIPDVSALHGLVTAGLAHSSIFAALFRENAGRALLLPKRRPGGRTPLWALRRRAASLLSVATRFSDFPIVLETYRHCMSDYFDLRGLEGVLQRIASGELQVIERETTAPSPFAAGLVFQFVARFMYQHDAPLAERRAQALTLDTDRLRQLLGEAAYRELLVPEVLSEIERELSGSTVRLDHADRVHDLLLRVGPIARQDLLDRHDSPDGGAQNLALLLETGRVFETEMNRQSVFVAAEDAARIRDGLGLSLPSRLPQAFLEPVADALGDLVRRYARTHGPFSAEDVASHFGLTERSVTPRLLRLRDDGHLTQGQFRPGSEGDEWCDTQVLARLKQASLRALRAQVRAVSPATLARFALAFHGLRPRALAPTSGAPSSAPSRGAKDHSAPLLPVLERLEGLPLSLTTLERQILPARVPGYTPGDLDALCVSGEVIWQGVAPGPGGDPTVALYLSQHFSALGRRAPPLTGTLHRELVTALEGKGGLFFRELSAMLGGFAQDLLAALWDLVWNGQVSNDTLVPLRRRLGGSSFRAHRPLMHGRGRHAHRASPRTLPGSEGRFWLTASQLDNRTDATEQSTELARSLLMRHGVVTREAVLAEGIQGGFTRLYPIFKALEERAVVHRGYFVAGLTPTQFAQPGAEAMLRAHKTSKPPPCFIGLAATDPANAYGSTLPWPKDLSLRPERAPGAHVILMDGELLAFLSRSRKHLATRLNEVPEARALQLAAVVQCLTDLVHTDERRFVLLETIDGAPSAEFDGAAQLETAGFRRTSKGLLLRADDATQAYASPQLAAEQ